MGTKVKQRISLKRTNINLGSKQHSELMQLSHETGLHVSDHIRRAVDEYLDRQKRRAGKSKAAVR